MRLTTINRLEIEKEIGYENKSILYSLQEKGK